MYRFYAYYVHNRAYTFVFLCQMHSFLHASVDFYFIQNAENTLDTVQLKCIFISIKMHR